jgi:CRISPR-associated protein Cmr5
MHAVDQYLEAALTVVQNLPADMMKGDEVKKVYKGYIASFGTIVKQSGLLPAAVLFGKEGGNDRSEGNKKHVTELILKILKLKGMDLSAADFIAYARNSDANRRAVLHAAVALKLALRTRKFTNS